MHTIKRYLMATAALTVLSTPALAEGEYRPCPACAGHAHHHASPLNYAPAGVMGDHMHGKGDFMLSYGYMRMDMEGNRDGTDRLSPDKIVTTYANRFSAVSGQPNTLRIVPTEMTMDMHMLGAMYGLSDKVTLMAMLPYHEKTMDHITYMGGSGTTVRGGFTTKTEGWGDVKLTSLVRIKDTGKHKLHANIGLSLPTGSIDERGTALTPMGMQQEQRLPYAMQLGSGTYDVHPGFTYTGRKGAWGWGAQYAGEIRLESENREGYSWGDKHTLSAWGAYQWAPWVSSSLRLTGSTQDSIDGIDPQIVAPVQTANPSNFGGKELRLGLGINLIGTKGQVKGAMLGLEAELPLPRSKWPAVGNGLKALTTLA